MEQMEVEVRVNENDIVKVAVGDTTRILVDAYSGRNFQGMVTEIANSAERRGQGTTEQVSEYVVKIRVITPHNLTSSPEILRKAADAEIVEDELTPYFKPGMSASVDIETQTEFNVVSVPIQSVTVRDFATINQNESDSLTVEVASESSVDTAGVKREDIRRVVFVVDSGSVNMIEVETGITDDQNIQILRGIDAGTKIVTGNYRVLSRQLKDGDKVRTN